MSVRLFVYYAVNWFYGRSINCCRFLIKETHCRQAYRPRHGWINKSDGPQYEQRNGDANADTDNWAPARTSRAGRQRAYANGFYVKSEGQRIQCAAPLHLLLLQRLLLPAPAAVVKCMPSAPAVPQNSLTALLPFSSCAQLAASCFCVAFNTPQPHTVSPQSPPIHSVPSESLQFPFKPKKAEYSQSKLK